MGGLSGSVSHEAESCAGLGSVYGDWEAKTRSQGSSGGKIERMAHCKLSEKERTAKRNKLMNKKLVMGTRDLSYNGRSIAVGTNE